MNNIAKKILTILFLYFSFTAKTQENIDSLFTLLNTTKQPEQLARINNLISDYYLTKDFEKSNKYANNALSIAKKINSIKNISDAYINLANSFFYKGNYDSTLYYYNKSYQLFLTTNDSVEIASSLNRLGLIYQAKSNYTEAVNYFLKSLKRIANQQYNTLIIKQLHSNKIFIFYSKFP